MSDWCKGLPEATEFSLFPPAGKARYWIANKERVELALERAFPGLSFRIADIGLDEGAVVIPILGEAGEGGRGICAAPPPPARLREIERAVDAFDLNRAVS